MSKLTLSPAWQALAAHRRAIAMLSLRELFSADANRAERLSAEFGEILLDFSKQRIDAEALNLLLALGRQADVPGWTRRMFAGEPINNTERRAVLHVALRSDRGFFPDGQDVMPGAIHQEVMPMVRQARESMRAFVGQAHRGALAGATGKPITDIVNIGIGGSDLGPRMAVRALRRFHKPGLRLHFTANMDPADLDAVLAGLRPESTLFIAASKTFTTAETLGNAGRARRWLKAEPALEHARGDPARLAAHFAAVTANAAGALAWGIREDRIFPMWDWVGGRYSLWSCVGLPVALAIGMDEFEELLEGARAMDAHFHTAPLGRNLPALLALLSVWNVNFCGAQSHAVLPYSEDLRDFPAYLQQLEMESNGKRVDRDGAWTDYATSPVIWGAAGTSSQHSFHQLLHQGTAEVPVDFIVFAAGEAEPAAQAALAANALAQSAALAFGTPGIPGAPHRDLPGNRPSTTLLLRRLTPHALGQLIALYEHKVFVQGVIWNINSFDQWGVEHGKQLARTLLPGLLEGGDSGERAGLDSSTRALLGRLRERDGS